MSQQIHYRVQWGENLEGIAKRFSINLRTLEYYNHIDSVYPNQVLAIPTDDVNGKKKIILTHPIEYYFFRHINKKRYFKFYK